MPIRSSSTAEAEASPHQYPLELHLDELGTPISAVGRSQPLREVKIDEEALRRVWPTISGQGCVMLGHLLRRFGIGEVIVAPPSCAARAVGCAVQTAKNRMLQLHRAGVLEPANDADSAVSVVIHLPQGRRPIGITRAWRITEQFAKIVSELKVLGRGPRPRQARRVHEVSPTTRPNPPTSGRWQVLGAAAALVTGMQAIAAEQPLELSTDRIAATEVNYSATSSLNEEGTKRAVAQACGSLSGCRVVEIGTDDRGQVQAVLMVDNDVSQLSHRMSEASIKMHTLSVVDTGLRDELERQQSSQRNAIEVEAIRRVQDSVSAATKVAGPASTPYSEIASAIAARDSQIRSMQRASGVSRVKLTAEPSTWILGTIFANRDSIIATFTGAMIATFSALVIWRRRHVRSLPKDGGTLAVGETTSAVPHATLLSTPCWSSPIQVVIQPHMTTTSRYAGAALSIRLLDNSNGSAKKRDADIARVTPSVGGSNALSSPQVIPEPVDPLLTTEVASASTLIGSPLAAEREIGSELTAGAVDDGHSLDSVATKNSEEPPLKNDSHSPLEKVAASGYPLPPVGVWAKTVRLVLQCPPVWEEVTASQMRPSLTETAVAVRDELGKRKLPQLDAQTLRDVTRTLVLASSAGLTLIEVAKIATGGETFTDKALARAHDLIVGGTQDAIMETQKGANAIAALCRQLGIEVTVTTNVFATRADEAFLVMPVKASADIEVIPQTAVTDTRW